MHSRLWALERWSGSQQLRAPTQGLLRSLPGSAHQRDSGIFRGIPTGVVGIDLHQGNEEEGKKIPLRNNKQPKNKGRSSRKRVIFSPGKGEVWVKVIFSFRLLESIVLETEKSDPSPPRMWPMHKATHADGRVSQIPELGPHLYVVHLPALPNPSFPSSQICQSYSCLLPSALSISSAELTVE